MIAKVITYNKLKEAIRVAFDGDKDIFLFYDTNAAVTNVSEIVEDISRKIDTYDDPVYRGVYEKNKLIGYFVYQKKQLISFALAMEYRVRKYLQNFFALIKRELKKPLICCLWQHNLRAIRFLQKFGCKLVSVDKNIVTLAYI